MQDQIEADGVSNAALTALNRGPWFSRLPPGVKDDVLRRARAHGVAAGTCIARRGAVADQWVGVVQGALRLSVGYGDDRVFTIDLLGPGQWFGDDALLQGGPADVDMVAHVASTVLVVPKADVHHLMRSHTEFRDALLHLSCQRLRDTYERCEERHGLDLSRRLARQIVRLAAAFGRPTVDGLLVDVPMSQADLASMLGASRQRVNSALRRMQERGLLRHASQNLLIIDADRLAEAGVGGAVRGSSL
jgi:CRP-like cAMP-binding protein